MDVHLVSCKAKRQTGSKFSDWWLGFRLEVAKQRQPGLSPAFLLGKQCLLALKSKLGLCIHSVDIKGMHGCKKNHALTSELTRL